MAKSIKVSIEIDVPIARVWNEVSNISNHIHWMHDAKSIEFLSKIKKRSWYKDSCINKGWTNQIKGCNDIH